ncbi:alpha/beta fold hydrolase [Oceanomicrobium pacificus]|uniref:Alpha/beta fold hydrolase n=1 Tax=Oceanomicrobium pacificus TaxID=2692916 RepID=A0A6B0TQC1_9RHOB|nr:alpha/beta fold hydrolase [Oceanomicrobium pacificus]MXU63995.1 alpha/beta fold hydrolase [Oceanomicrobium pacificus]
MPSPAPHRIGQPSPLLAHLGLPALSCQTALATFARADDPAFPWHPSVRAEGAALAGRFTGLDLAQMSAERLRALSDGIAAWQAHPYRRTLPDFPSVWSSGSTHLRDAAPGAAGQPVLLVPSLINRATILDLMEDCSLLRWLATEGLHPYLIDWGTPGPAERDFGLADYGARRLMPALAVAGALAGRKPALLGYCMGGTLALGLAARDPDAVAGVATLGAPWDFALADGHLKTLRTAMCAAGPDAVARTLDALGTTFGAIPVDLFQSIFAALNPFQANAKFRHFATLDPTSPEAVRFVALEDWLADGRPMAAPAARDLIVDWHLRNDLPAGRWSFLGGPVDPSRLTAPALLVSGRRDHIAAPAMGAALAARLPDADHLIADTGHVGMIVGRNAQTQVWEPVRDFLLGLGG